MQVTFLIWHEVINTAKNIRELSSLTFLIRPNTFIILTLVHGMGGICLSKRSSESIKTPSSVSILVNLIEVFPKSDLVGFSNSTRDAIFRVGFYMVICQPSKKIIRCGLQFRDYSISIRRANVKCGLISIVFNVRILTFMKHVYQIYVKK